MNTKSFRRFNAFMDFVTVMFIGGFVVVTISIICIMFGIQLDSQIMLATMVILFLFGFFLAIRQLYGKLTEREIFREMTDEQYEKYIKNKNWG